MNASSRDVWANGSCVISINDFKHKVYPAAYILIFILGTVGHSLSICVFFSQWRSQKTFTPVNLLMVNLLVSDLMLVCSLPLRAYYYLQGSHWPFGDVPCRLILYVFYLNMYSSVYFLVALNVLRYLALMRPYLYMRLQTSCAAGVVCSLIWLLMAVANSPLLFSKRGTHSSTHCLELVVENMEKMLIINYASFALCFGLPVLVILYCSVFVVRSLLKPSPALGRTRPCRKKACALVIISLVIFLVCFLPYHVVRSIFLSAEKGIIEKEPDESCQYILLVRKAAVLTQCLCTANSCLDPVLFFFVGEHSRSFFARWFGGRKSGVADVNKRKEEVQNLQST